MVMTARSQLLQPSPDLDPRDEVLDVEEAAAFLRISTSMLRSSDIPRSRVGARIVFLRSRLLRYVADHEVGKAP